MFGQYNISPVLTIHFSIPKRHNVSVMIDCFPGMCMSSNSYVYNVIKNLCILGGALNIDF